MSAPRRSVIAPLVCIATAVIGGCGRFGYEARDGDGGPPDARDDGDGGVTPDGGPGPAGCDEDTLVVTTAADEDDPGESPAPPHIGDGLSLREAIGIANDRTGLDCIVFAGVTAISVGSELPPLEDPDGTAIDGAGGVVLSAGGEVATGLRLVSSENQIFNLELTSIQVCLQVNGPMNLVRGVHIHDCAITGVVVAAAATGTEVGPCLVHDVGGTGIQALGTSGLRIVDCTITANGGSGVDATAGGAALVVENSIVYDNRDHGIAVDPGAPVEIDYDDLAENRLENCLNCIPGASSISADPLFVDPVNDDYSLATGSPAIDAGRVNGIDVNGAAAGDYNGAAPDMGGLESP